MTATAEDRQLADVGGVDEFEHAKPRIVKANGRDIAVYRWHERYIAVRNRCAHQGMSFRGGGVVERVQSGASRLERRPTSEPELVCPVHGYSFDAGGQCVTHAHLRIKAYPVQVRDGRVLVDTGRGTGAAKAEPDTDD